LILGSPEIIAIYWDDMFQQVDWTAERVNQFIRDMSRSAWMRGLAQYGVQPMSLLSWTLIWEDPPDVLTGGHLETRLIGWLDSGAVSPKPAGRELNKLYLVVTPNRTELQ